MVAKSKILIIDDEPEILELLKTSLEKSQLEVITALDGIEGFTKACEQIPDLIILDVMMPKVDGFTVLRKIRAEDATRTIPVIMLTGDGMTGTIFKAQIYGATDYIIKPFKLSELLKFISKYIAIFGKPQE